MKPFLRRIVVGFVAFVVLVPVLAVGAGQLGLFKSEPPGDLGLKDGRLKPPSLTRNSVSSQAALYPNHPQKDYAGIAPFKYTGDGKAAMARLASIVAATPGATVVLSEPGYLYAECETPLMRFTDDVEFALDEAAGVIHVRSASRLGKGDMGTNRKRVEALRARFGG